MALKTQLKTLDEVITYAEKYATFAMRDLGQIGAAFIIFATNGSAIFLPADTTNEQTKSESRRIAGLMCIAHVASSVVFVAEAWMNSHPDAAVSPSSGPNRKEVIILTAEGYGRCKQKILPIIRDASENFSGFGESLVYDNAKGRFTNILPPEPPTAEVQDRANRLLAAMGINYPVSL